MNKLGSKILYLSKLGLKLGVLGIIMLVTVFGLKSCSTPTVEEVDTGDWFSFPVPEEFSQEAYFSSGNQEKPAGGKGYVQVTKNGNFALPSGKRIRFWGTSIGYDALHTSKEKARKIAANIDRLGFNLVRISSLDAALVDNQFNDTRHLDEKRLDQFDYLFHQLKQRGIYVELTLTAHRKFKKGDEVQDWNDPQFTGGYRQRRLLRAMTMVDPHLLELQKEFVKKLLDHENPYTGNKYSNEPGIAAMEIINETTLDLAWISGMLNFNSPRTPRITSYYSKMLDLYWFKWLEEKYGTTKMLKTAWEKGGGKGLRGEESLEDGNVKRVRYANRNGYSNARIYDTLRFYQYLQRKYFKEMSNYLRKELGVQVPISNSHTYHGIPHLMNQAEGDFTGIHIVWQHPLISAGWRKAKYLDNPMVKAETPSKNPVGDWVETKNTLYRMSFGGAVKGKPLVVSETNSPFPNSHQSEYPLLLAAYGSLQDWDGIIFHQYLYHPERLGHGKIDAYFTIANNPAILSQMPTASRLFREGRVRQADSESVVHYSEKEAFDSLLNCGINIHCTYENLGVDPHLVYTQKVRNEFQKGPQPKDKPKNPFTANDGGLKWDINQGLATIKTDKTEAMIGFTGGRTIDLGAMKVTSRSNFSSISVTSLDDKKIEESNRLLLVTAGTAKNTDMTIRIASDGFHKIEDWGKKPVLCEPVPARINLRLAGDRTVKIFPMAPDGELRGDPIATSGGGTISFSTGDHDTIWYGIKVS